MKNKAKKLGCLIIQAGCSRYLEVLDAGDRVLQHRCAVALAPHYHAQLLQALTALHRMAKHREWKGVGFSAVPQWPEALRLILRRMTSDHSVQRKLASGSVRRSRQL